MIKCNKCGKIVEEYDSYSFRYANFYITPFDSADADVSEFDLCQDCFKNFKKWLENE